MKELKEVFEDLESSAVHIVQDSGGAQCTGC